jgi:hypothetical protein
MAYNPNAILSLLGGSAAPMSADPYRTPQTDYISSLLGAQEYSNMSVPNLPSNPMLGRPLSLFNPEIEAKVPPAPKQSFLGAIGQGIGERFSDPDFALAFGTSMLRPRQYEVGIGQSIAEGLLAGRAAQKAKKEEDMTNLLMTANIEAKLREAGGFDKTFGNEKDMRKEYNDLTKDFRESLAGFNKVKQAAALDTGAGDIALIFGFMKTIDPSSVVRESEFDLAQNTGGAPDRAKAYINRVISGQRLTPDQRKYFIDAAASQMDAIVSLQRDIEKRYGYLSQRYGYDPKNIVDEYSSRYTKDASIVVGTKENPHIVSSEAEGDKLPEGTYYQVGNTIYQSDGGVR